MTKVTTRGRKALEELSHEDIMAHVLDPENSPLTPRQQEQYNRVLSAAQMLDEYPSDVNVMKLLREKYKVTEGQCYADIRLAKQVFKSRHTFDWDFWHAWELKDQIELIKKCKEQDDLKNWNAAKKVFHEILGERPPVVGDPRRMEKNVFYIQVHNGTNQNFNIPLDQIRSLSDDDRKAILDAAYQPINDTDAEEIFDS